MYGCSCDNCKYCETVFSDEPCLTCHRHSKFEPMELEEKEKEKKTMDRRTKVQLLEAIEEKDAEIKDLKEEIKNLEKYEKYKEVADETKVIHTAFVDSGFTEEQAFELMKTLISSAANMNRPRLF